LPFNRHSPQPTSDMAWTTTASSAWKNACMTYPTTRLLRRPTNERLHKIATTDHHHHLRCMRTTMATSRTIPLWGHLPLRTTRCQRPFGGLTTWCGW
jgi:hypothetical protein